MAEVILRSVKLPIRDNLTLSDRWDGPDKGLIWCWERGRQKRLENPDLAKRADKGELIILVWEGGVEKKLKIDKKPGTLQYLATWQGLRNEDLNINLDDEHIIECTKTGQIVVFSAGLPMVESNLEPPK